MFSREKIRRVEELAPPGCVLREGVSPQSPILSLVSSRREPSDSSCKIKIDTTKLEDLTNSESPILKSLFYSSIRPQKRQWDIGTF